MSARYRVRFAPENIPGFLTYRQQELPCATGKNSAKSRLGCRECKHRRVKCDERYPICRHCERRNVVCHAAPRSVKWQFAMPWLSSTITMDANVSRLCHDNQQLLQYWFEHVSQMMVLVPDENPLSYPVMEHVATSKPLLHAILSFTIAHQHYFMRADLNPSLIHRGLALSSLQKELQAHQKPPVSSFLTVMLLGWSSFWIEQDTMEWRKEHVRGARIILDAILRNTTKIDSSVHFIAGAYIYWDMTIGLTTDTSDFQPLDIGPISTYIRDYKDQYHPIAGRSLEIFYILADLGRYCRRILHDGTAQDPLLELSFESKLLGWDIPQHNDVLYLLGDSFRKHGLIMLHRSCHRALYPGSSLVSVFGSISSSLHDIDFMDSYETSPQTTSGTSHCIDYDEGSLGHFYEQPGKHLSQSDNESDASDEIPKVDISLSGELLLSTLVNEANRDSALEVVTNLTKIPLSSPYFSIQGIPLLSAGSELTADDMEAREEILKRFKALYSVNRSEVNLWACDILQKVWSLRDENLHYVTLYEIALQEGNQWWLA